MNIVYPLAVSLIVGLFASSLPARAQNSEGSTSLSSLSSKGLLGDSTNAKDFGKLPTNITSDSLTVNAKNRIFTYKGNVTVTQGDMRLTSKEIDGSYSEQNEIQKIIARGDVTITKQDIKATSQLATYDAVASIVTLTDNPQLQQGESVLIADRIKVYLNENRSQAEGNVRVTFVKKDGTPIPTGGTPAPNSATSPLPVQSPIVTAPPQPANTPAPQAKPQPTPTPKPKKTVTPKPSPKSKKTPSKSAKPTPKKTPQS
jgi:lipopolysaccharide export system protein LptA